MSNPNLTLARINLAVRLTVLWVIVAVISFVILKVAKIGPTIYTISAERGWGVHSGDFLFLIPVAVAVVLTVKWWKGRK